MISEQRLKKSIWIIILIIGLILFTSGVFAAAAMTEPANYDDGTSGGSSGGGTYSCTGTLDCFGVNEVYPVKAQQFCQYNYDSVCDWDTDRNLCVNADSASCSGIPTSTLCSSIIGCSWSSTTTTTTSTCTGGTTYCANLGRCVSLYSDESACGSCWNVCYGGTVCQSGNCVSSATTTCDGVVVPTDEVECNTNTPEPCNVTALHTGTQRCMLCQWGECISNTGYCGDETVNGAETCDAAGQTRACTVNGNIGTQKCKEDCTGWDDLCTPTIYCLPSCTTEGKWTSFEEGFSMNDNNVLTFTGTGTRTIMGDGTELFAGKTYTFDAKINGNVIIYLNNTCLSNTSFTQKDCGVGQTLYNGPSSVLPKTFTMPTASGGHAINGLYYRNVSIYVVFTGPGTLSNISLRESSTAHYDYLPTGVATYGCCPNDYCWDGFMCVNSKLWMNNASYPPLWNTFNIAGLNSSHIPANLRTNAEGYRCVKPNPNASAAWVFSYVKYAPDFVQSGYCSETTECFLPGASTNDASTGCVPSGYMSENNYCHMGNWTTRSYILATLFQDLAQSNYVLHCYDNETMVHNSMVSYATSACVLTQPGESNVLIGLIPGATGATINSNYITYINGIITTTVDTYSDQYDYSPEPPEYSCTSTEAELIPNSNFSICMESNEDPGLFIYYETNYGFLVVSNERVVGIDTPTLWDKVKQFFRDIFTRKLTIVPYTTLDYVTSYDKIYVLRDQGIAVTAIEERKYDESLMKPVNVFYIRYEGSDNNTNPINSDQLLKAINKSISRRSILNVEYNLNSGGQELIIQTDNSTRVWKYFTAMLRTRDTEGRTTPGASRGINESVISSPGAPAGAVYGSSDSNEILSGNDGQESGNSSGTGSGTVIITGVTNAPPSCIDNILNQGEMGFADCGGPCTPCTCYDEISNQDEFEYFPDCGGVCGTNAAACPPDPDNPEPMGSGTNNEIDCTVGLWLNEGEPDEEWCGPTCCNELMGIVVTNPDGTTTGTTTTTTTTGTGAITPPPVLGPPPTGGN